MKNRVPAGLLLLAAVSGAGCAPSVCDRGAALANKKGDCTSALGNPLAPAATCSTRVAACSTADTTTIGDALTCLEKLSSCQAADEASYLAGEAACLAKLTSISTACSDGLFGGVVPGTDAGTDAGTVDAGRQAFDGGALELIAVADETSIALAWVRLQDGQVAKWELTQYADGGRLPEQTLTPGARRAMMVLGVAPLLPDGGASSGVERSFFITGLLNDGTIVTGAQPDAGGGTTFTCSGPLGCPSNQICDLGMCHIEACSTTNNTCPAGYDCPAGTCLRSPDAGFFDAGTITPPSTFNALPFISNLATVTTGKPGWSVEQPIGGFVSKRPDMVAIDSARQFVAMEQENQPVGHLTVRRGRDLLNDLGTTSVIDTVGDHVQVTYAPDSDTLFACYTVGRGVRVRRSYDHGRSWGTDALTFEPADDGGFQSRFHSCDLAPWRNGGALMVNVEDDNLVVRNITQALSVASTETAFISSPTDGGGYNVYNPFQPSIGTAPDAGIVHVVFTGQRVLASASDYEVYDVVKSPQTGGVYSPPKFINQNLPSLIGNGQNQGFPTVAVDPLSGRAVAAFSSYEGSYSNVYVTMFNPAFGEWVTGSDLHVFVRQTTEYLLFPSRVFGAGEWDAFSPTIRARGDGKIWLGFIAGKQAQPPATVKNEYRSYAVRFDFEAQSPVGGKGWFARPAEKLSDTPVLDPRLGGGQVPPTVSCLALDEQLSVYSTFVEGLGQFYEIENRAVYSSRP